MKAKAAAALGAELAGLIAGGRMDQAKAALKPVLSQRVRFPLLGRIGAAVGKVESDEVNTFLDWVAASQSEGGWVIIGCALGERLGQGLGAVFQRCRRYICQAGTWYSADILGERVPGPALLESFHPALQLLTGWRSDEVRWVRRAAGVALHFWAKRTKGDLHCSRQAQAALDFLTPAFTEWEMDSVKGFGWGLKTLGRYFPDLTADWLFQQAVVQRRPHRALMRKKALTYLKDDSRRRAIEALR